jgi:hypothetical protein
MALIVLGGVMLLDGALTTFASFERRWSGFAYAARRWAFAVVVVAGLFVGILGFFSNPSLYG